MPKKDRKVTESEVELLKKKVELLEKEVELREVEKGRMESKALETKPETDLEAYKKSKILYEWKAPSRVFVKRDKKWFLTVGVVTLILIFLLILVEKPFLIVVILSTVFLAYVLATTPPVILEHSLTSKGVYSFEKLFRWGDLKSYWFSKVQGQDVLYINTKNQFNPRIVMLVGEGSMSKLNNIVQEYIPYHFIKKQKKISRFLDGEYVRSKEVPGKKPDTDQKEG